MKIKSSVIFYLTIIGAFTALMFFVLDAGSHLEIPAALRPPAGTPPEISKKMSGSPVVIFLGQIIVIVLASVFCGAICKRCGQPRVIGEIIAGIILGPSLLGRLLPGVSSLIFPAGSLGNIQLLSQLGLILFMFIVGMETDLGMVNKKIPAALVISHAGIAIPFTLGVTLSYFLYKEFAPGHVPFYAFSLFIGISMSITAFPVLAGIMREKGLTGTRMGNLVITCAAADDITAWCLLAVVLSVITGGSSGASLNIILLTIAYLGGMLLIVKPLVKKLFKGQLFRGKTNNGQPGTSGGPVLALIFVFLFTSACCSELIGIHVLFGAFIAGICMPERKDIRNLVTGKIEDFTVILLLPLFFVFTGLRTRIDLLNQPALWAICILIIVVAIAGKFGGSAVAASCMGESLKDSLTIGALMNTRGLVELVVLNIGYDMGILTPGLFTMMVIMALFTTFLTSPALSLIDSIKGSPFLQASEKI